jgi:hypothetical protein
MGIVDVVVLKTEVVEELCSRWSGRLEIPSFVKLCMMACLYDAGIEVEIEDVLVHGSVTKEDTREVMLIQFSTAIAHSFYAYPSAKQFKQ